MRSVMTAMSLIPASTASMTASFANAAGTNTMAAFALLWRTASSTASKTGTPSTFWPPLPGVTPATTFVPKSSIARVWNWPWWPVIPCTTTRLFRVRRTATSPRSVTDLHREFRRLLDRLRGIHADVAQDLFRLVLVHAFDSGHDGHVRVHDLEGLLDADGDGIGFRDAAEDVEQDCRRLGFQEDLECFRDLPRVVRTAEVEEGATSTTLQVQDVERGHRQARAVRDNADIPIELDERDALLVGLLLERRAVLIHARVFGMAVLRVVVDDELRIPGDHSTVFREDEGINLDELRVLLAEQVVRFARDVDDLVCDFFGQAEGWAQRPPHVGLRPDEHRDMLHEDPVARQGLDVNAPHRARHEQGLAGRPVNRKGEVEFFLDIETLLEIHLLDRVSADCHSQNLSSDAAGLIQAIRGPNPSRPAATPD